MDKIEKKILENLNKSIKISISLFIIAVLIIIISINTLNSYNGFSGIVAIFLSTPLFILGAVFSLFGFRHSSFRNVICWIAFILNGLPILLITWSSIPFTTDIGIIFADKNKTVLYLDSTNVSNFGLRQLKQFKELKELELQYTNIDDSGIKYLTALKSLESLNVRSTKISAEGIAELKRHLPKCQIYGPCNN